MESRMFDSLTRLVGATANRRAAVSALVASVFAGAAASVAPVTAATAAERGPSPAGPCGNAKQNRCTKNKQCCTGYCDSRKNRCRCAPKKTKCTNKTVCCGGLTCTNGRCQAVCRDSFAFATLFETANFDQPRGVAITPDQRQALISDSGTDSVFMFTRPSATSNNWSFATSFSNLGSGAADLDTPRFLATTSDGLTVLVADNGNNRVSVWTRADTTTTTWTHQINFGSAGSGQQEMTDPVGVAITADGTTAFITDNGNSRVTIWQRSSITATDWTGVGEFTGAGPTALDDPEGLALSSDELTLFVVDTDGQTVSVWSRPDTSSLVFTHQYFIGSSTEFSEPKDAAIRPDGLMLMVTDQDKSIVTVWTRPNVASTAWTMAYTLEIPVSADPDQFNEPYGIAFTADGVQVLVADSDSANVSVWKQTCP